jgi:hypothetical protein
VVGSLENLRSILWFTLRRVLVQSSAGLERSVRAQSGPLTLTGLGTSRPAGWMTIGLRVAGVKRFLAESNILPALLLPCPRKDPRKRVDLPACRGVLVDVPMVVEAVGFSTMVSTLRSCVPVLDPRCCPRSVDVTSRDVSSFFVGAVTRLTDRSSDDRSDPSGLFKWTWALSLSTFGVLGLGRIILIAVSCSFEWIGAFTLLTFCGFLGGFALRA